MAKITHAALVGLTGYEIGKSGDDTEETVKVIQEAMDRNTVNLQNQINAMSEKQNNSGNDKVEILICVLIGLCILAYLVVKVARAIKKSSL